MQFLMAGFSLTRCPILQCSPALNFLEELLYLDGRKMSMCSVRTGRTSLSVKPKQKATNQHTRAEFDELLDYDQNALPKRDLDYFKKCKNDLRNVLLEYRGARVRDIKNIFHTHAKYNVDLERLKLKSWAHFLIAVGNMVEYMLEMKNDVDREVLYVYECGQHLSEADLKAIPKEAGDMQSPIKKKVGKDETNPIEMSPITAASAYFKGFLDAADGQARTDPRVPIQDMGVQATETLLMAKTNPSFEDKRKKDNVVTVETTAPLTQDGSLDNFFSWMSIADQAAANTEVILKPLGKDD